MPNHYAELSDQELMAVVANEKQQGREANKQTLLDTISGFAQGATLGLGDEIAAGNQALTNFVFSGGSTNIANDYAVFIDRERLRLANAAENSPVATVIGNSFGVAPFMTYGLATGNPVAIQTFIGATQGFGNGIGATDSLQRSMFDATTSLGGAGTGKALQKIGNSKAISQRVFEKITNFVNKKAVSNINVGDPSDVVKAAERAQKLTAGGKKAADIIDKNIGKAGLGLVAAGAGGVPLAGTLGSGLVAKKAFGTIENALPGILPTIGGNTARVVGQQLNDAPLPPDRTDYSALTDEELMLLINGEQ